MCGKEYVGQTSKTLRIRKKQHEDAVAAKKVAKSSLALHAVQAHARVVPSYAFKILEKCRDFNQVKSAEALHILRRSSKLNVQRHHQ